LVSKPIRRAFRDQEPAGRPLSPDAIEDFDSIAGVYPALLRKIAPAANVEVTLQDGARLVQDVRLR
jgi:hypothetical protein